MPEEAESAIREVNDDADDDKGDNPVLQGVKNTNTRADEQLNEVVTDPRYEFCKRETSCGLKCRCCRTNECIQDIC